MHDNTPQILIIDDEPQILKMLFAMLSRQSLNIDTAGNGEDGIRKIKSNNYSLIITDIKMPGITGIQVCEYTRNIKNDPTPVVGMSGTPWLLDDGLFDAVLSKPFSRKELLEIVNTLLPERTL